MPTQQGNPQGAFKAIRDSGGKAFQVFAETPMRQGLLGSNFFDQPHLSPQTIAPQGDPAHGLSSFRK